jgi:hypothetical protein
MFMCRVTQLCRRVVGGRARVAAFAVLAALLCVASVPSLHAQSFTLTPTTLTPAAVDPGGEATAQISLGVTSSVGSISLTCTVSSNNSSVSTSDYPGCLISPNSATSNAILSLTVTAGSDTPAGEYSVTVTGTASSETETTSPLYLNVVDVQQDYSLTVTKTISPGTVSPGGGAEATVTVTPIASYTGTVTLSCLSVSPAEVAGPYCSFNPPTVTVSSSTGSTSVLTVSTYGTQQTVGELEFPRALRSLWLVLPGLVLASVGTGRVRRKRVTGFLVLLLTVASGFLILPSCGGKTTTSNNTIGYVTPKDTYTFTLTGVDQNGVSPSNTTTDQATVSLTVN